MAEVYDRMPRKSATTLTRTRVLQRSGRRCAFCFGLDHSLDEKKGQIAHVDRNPANSHEDNLAFLCKDHHDEYDSTRRQSKGLTAEELKGYRSDLYEAIERLARRRDEAAAPARAEPPPSGLTIGGLVGRLGPTGRVINSSANVRVVLPEGVVATVGAIAGSVDEGGQIEGSRGDMEVMVVPAKTGQ